MAKKKTTAAPAAAEQPKRGRPGFKPTDIQRGEVRGFTIAGYGEAFCAKYLGISEPTLRLHFKDELAFSQPKLIAGAVTNLGRMALGAPAQFDEKGNKIRDEVKPDLGAICFLLKTKGKHLGWSERLELVGKDGDAIQHNHAVINDVRGLIAEELGTKPATAAPTKH